MAATSDHKRMVFGGVGIYRPFNSYDRKRLTDVHTTKPKTHYAGTPKSASTRLKNLYISCILSCHEDIFRCTPTTTSCCVLALSSDTSKLPITSNTDTWFVCGNIKVNVMSRLLPVISHCDNIITALKQVKTYTVIIIP